MYEKIHRWTDDDQVVATVEEEREELERWDEDTDADDRLGIRGKRREIREIILGGEE